VAFVTLKSLPRRYRQSDSSPHCAERKLASGRQKASALTVWYLEKLAAGIKPGQFTRVTEGGRPHSVSPSMFQFRTLVTTKETCSLSQ
jgi:hypothetical protein